MTFKVYIPARYDSTRLPGKALADLGGQTLLEHVYRRALASGAAEVVIATDDARIAACAEGFGATVCMTSPAHQSGTDRIAQAAALRGESPEAVIVNLQGDEPFMPAAVIRQVAAALAADPQVDIATVCEPVDTLAQWQDPNVVKVVRDVRGRALYFSRAAIPHPRDGDHEWSSHGPFYRHVGIYAYRCDFLQRFVRWAPATLETLERLEQLRALCQGAVISVPTALEPCGVGIDTPADLAHARRLMAAG